MHARLFLLLALVALPAPAMAQQFMDQWTQRITAQQFTTARSTGCMEVAGRKWLYLRGEVTRGGTLAAMKVSCMTYRGEDCNGIGAPALLCIDNICAQWEPTLSNITANTALRVRMDVAGDDRAVCTYTNTSGGTADDVLNAYTRTVQE